MTTEIIQKNILEKTLDAALSTQADFAEVFVEDCYTSLLTYRNQKADQVSSGTIFGAGIRVFFGKEVVYVTTNDLSEAGLIKAAKLAAQSRGAVQLPGQSTDQNSRLQLVEKKLPSVHRFGVKPWEYSREKKFGWLKVIDQYARSHSTDVTQVQAYFTEKFQKVQIANSKGTFVYDERPYSRIVADTMVERDGLKESMHSSEGHLGTAEFVESIDLQRLALENVKSALTLLDAKHCPAGDMPVIIDHGFGGVLFHEACGHGLETTSVEKNASVFCGKLGEKIANDCVTAIDDGTLVNGWGSSVVDDEGNLTQKTVLIEKGVLKSYMVDEMGAIKTGYAITGSGRRNSYKFAPASRMRNTFIAPGTDTFESMVKDIDYGLYAKKMGGGSVTPGTGDYNFQVTEAYLIRDGKLEEAVKGACLIGKGIDTLAKIVKVSSDLKIDPGMCGSVSGMIPAACGQPQVMVSKLTVGGRA